MLSISIVNRSLPMTAMTNSSASWPSKLKPSVGFGPQRDDLDVRLNGRSVLCTVRAFYLDIAEWADDDVPAAAARVKPVCGRL